MPTHDIPSGSTYASGDTAPTVRTKLNANVAWAEAQMQGIEDRLEATVDELIGSGIVNGLAVSAGSGLSVDVAAGTAIVGHSVTKSAGTTGVAVTASDESYVYLVQDGTFSVNTTGTAPTSQASILLAVVTCDASSVTAVDNDPVGKEKLSLLPDLGSGDGIATSPLGDDWVGSSHIDWGSGSGQVGADDVPVVASGFSGNLSSADDDVQAALGTLDAMTPGGTAVGSDGQLQYAASGALDSDANLVYDETADELQLGASTKAVIGSDVNLYRGGADVLETDDRLRLGLDPSTDRDAMPRVYVLSRQTQMVTNAWGQMGSNYNFPGATYITTDARGGQGCYSYAGPVQERSGFESIPVDTDRRYRIRVWAKSVGAGGLSKIYVGHVCYDKDGENILPIHFLQPDVTQTTLASDLTNGDTTVYLTDASNWVTASGDGHDRNFAIFDDTYYSQFGDYYYTRKVYDYDDAETTGHTITLSSAWSGSTVPAGTKVANTHDGATYGYSGATSEFVPTDWTLYEGIVEGISESNDTYAFRPATAFIKPLILANWGQDSTYTVLIDGLTFAEEPYEYVLRSGDDALRILKNGDTEPRLVIDEEGKITWGQGGSTAPDVDLYRSAANVLRTPDTFQAGGYQSSDGSPGVTGTIDLTTATSITVKNGLIVGYS